MDWALKEIKRSTLLLDLLIEIQDVNTVNDIAFLIQTFTIELFRTDLFMIRCHYRMTGHDDEVTIAQLVTIFFC